MEGGRLGLGLRFWGVRGLECRLWRCGVETVRLVGRGSEFWGFGFGAAKFGFARLTA